MPTFDAFFEHLVIKGLEHFRLYYGLYRATVTRNDDPEKRGRVQAKVSRVHSIAPDIWIDPVFSGAGADRGSFFPPEVGDSVRVNFDHGNPAKPVSYQGGWFGGQELPREFAYTGGKKIIGQTGSVSVPERRGFITRGGHRITFADEDGKERVELAWHKRSATDPAGTADAQGDRSKSADRTKGDTSTVVFTPDGDIVMTNKNGSRITLGAKDKNIVVEDENKNVITMDNNGVTVKSPKIVLKAAAVEVADGADSPIPRGNELLAWLRGHTHQTAWGPSTVPVQPPPQSILSVHAKVK
jgi:uncharacterized protein involved in type VI secretion and phage assembly